MAPAMKIIGGPGGGYSTTPVLDYFREKGIGMIEQTKVAVPEGTLKETASDFANVFMFGAILERPATAKDEPVSEREKQQGIRENVICVRAEDYSRLLKAYQELVKKTVSTVDSKQ